MPKTKISEYSTTNADNTDIEGINIAEGCAPSGINNAIRELMVHLKEFQTGASGDGFTFAGGTLMTGTNTLSGTNVLSGSTTATFAAGTVSAPSIAAHGDTNTGIFFPAADTIAFAEGGAEAMRIDSNGCLQLGTTSRINTSIFSVAVNASTTNGPTFVSTNNQAQDFGGSLYLGGKYNSSGDYRAFAYISGAKSNSTDGNSSGYLAFATNGNAADPSERMRIDSSGNVGIGVTPSAWASPFSAVAQFTKGAIACQSNSILLMNNAYYDGANYKYVATAGAGYYEQSGGLHIWSSAASGTAGNNITFTERMRITSGGDVLINTTANVNNAKLKSKVSTGSFGLEVTDESQSDFVVAPLSGAVCRVGPTSGAMAFYTANSERARITSGGDFCVGKTAENDTTAGFRWSAVSKYTSLVRDSGSPLFINRLTNDGTLVEFAQDTTIEGTISVSGSTVSYNSFAGAHWTQLQQGRGYNPDILRGTVMSSIGEMAEWKSVVWDEVIEHPAVPAVEAVEGKEAVLDEEGNVIEPAVEAVAAVEGKDAWTETIPYREAYLGNLPVGATFTEDGVTKTVVDDGNERLPKVKISDVVGDKAVYGVFQTYDEVQDMLVTALGAFVVRIAAGVTVQIGDLLESNGDGCAKVQDDDVIRSKTIGKVTSTVKTATYADGSYTVPCVLYCG